MWHNACLHDDHSRTSSWKWCQHCVDQLHFLEWQLLCFDYALTEVCYLRYNWQCVCIASGNSLAQNWWQATTWTNDVFPDLNELINKSWHQLANELGFHIEWRLLHIVCYIHGSTIMLSVPCGFCLILLIVKIKRNTIDIWHLPEIF